MSYADYAASVPPGLQVLISVLVTVGVSVLLVWAFHGQLVQLAQEPEDPEDDSPQPPASHHLSGRIIQVTSVGFMFLFTFTVGQFVISARSADAATQLEAQYFSRAVSSAEQLPSGAGGDEVLAALSRYRTVVLTEEWPLMQRGDAGGAYELQGMVSTDVAKALNLAQESGAAESPSWGTLSSSVDEMLTAAVDRLGDVPSRNAVSLTLTVFFLGVVSLAMTAIFQPARRRLNLILIGVMAGVYGVLFYVVVELSNPFQGIGSVTSLMEFVRLPGS